MNPHQAVDYVLKNSKKYAMAKAQRMYLEEFRKSKKAILMSQSTAETAVAREQYAYAHPEYIEVLNGIREAVQEEERLRWELIAAQARVDIWRSEESTKRAEMNLS